MDLIISNNDKRPIYEQICSQIKSLIIKGKVKSGSPLPSIRQLAKDLHISVITVQHAYDELIRDGFIETVPGKGTFVSDNNPAFIQEEVLRTIEVHIEDITALAKEYNITNEQIVSVLKKHFPMRGDQL